MRRKLSDQRGAEPMMGSGRIQGWRGAMAPLRNEPFGANLLPTAVSQISAHVAAVFELPHHEVASDIIHIIQTVPTNWMHFETPEYATVCGGICRLVMDVSSRIQLEYKTATLLVLVRFLRRILEGSGTHWAGALEGDIGRTLVQQGSKTEWEALRALVQLIHEYGGQIPAEEISSIVSVLVRAVRRPNFATLEKCKKVTKIWTSRADTGQGESKAKYGQDERQYQRLIFTAIGNLFTRAGPLVCKETWMVVIKVLQMVLEIMVSTTLIEDPAASRCYAAVLRCLYLVLADCKSSLEEHVTGLVGALRVFFIYGLPNFDSSVMSKHANQVQMAAIKPGSWQDAKAKVPKNGAYRPPHLRGKIQAPSSKGGNIGARSSDYDVQGGWGAASSDSEFSDSDGQHDEGDRLKSAKVRANATLSIQALARTDPKVLHAHWVILLPTHDVLQPRPFQATLFSVLLFDPNTKARMAAASTVAVMLEGPARAYLQVAEYKEITRSKSFTTLSSSLGQMVIQLHIGLVHVIMTETHGGILVATLKALSLLVSAVPYSRLPAGLLPYTVYSLHQRIREIFCSSADQSNVLCAAINCLGAALSRIPPSALVAASLTLEACPFVLNAISSTWAPSANGPPCSDLLLPDLISYTQPPAPASVRVEAFQALKAAVHSCPSIVSEYWELLSTSILGSIEFANVHGGSESLDPEGPQTCGKAVVPLVSGQTARLVDDKVVHSATKLLDEFLRAACGYKGTDESLDDALLQPPSSFPVPKPMRLLTATGSSPLKLDTTEEIHFETIDSGTAVRLWLEALANHLPLTLNHAAPMVRGAALTCFAGLTNTIFSSLPSDKQDHVLSALISAAWNDDTPAVRSAACRAIGVVMGFPQVAGSKEKVDMAVEVVVSSTTDSSVSVRITASWALANICDALRNIAESSSSLLHFGTVSLTSLAECALKAAKDCDKVGANAVRALGNLARFVNFTAESHLQARSLQLDATIQHHQTNGLHLDSTNPGATEASRWLGMMVQTLVSCVTTGNVKVQWNVCHALGNLFLNKTICLSRMKWVPSVYSILLLLLRNSANFKIRIHSAAALAVPATREDYGDSYSDVLKSLIHALECTDNEHEMAPTSFKYIMALTDQLSTTVLHVLGLGIPEDFPSLKDFLLKKATFLQDFLTSLCIEGKSSMSAVYNTDIGVLDQLGAGSVAEVVVSSIDVYDEKPLPPPKGHRRYGLHMNDPLLIASGNLAQKVMCLRQAVRALAEMYRYGGIVNATQKLEVLVL